MWKNFIYNKANIYYFVQGCLASPILFINLRKFISFIKIDKLKLKLHKGNLSEFVKSHPITAASLLKMIIENYSPDMEHYYNSDDPHDFMSGNFDDDVSKIMTSDDKKIKGKDGDKSRK